MLRLRTMLILLWQNKVTGSCYSCILRLKFVDTDKFINNKLQIIHA
jgi:hypothetical protein